MDPITETIAETVAPAVSETIVTNMPDYMPILTEFMAKLQGLENAALFLSSFAMFFVVVCLGYFVYKFLRIFF